MSSQSRAVVAQMTRLRQDLRRVELSAKRSAAAGVLAAARVLKKAVVREAPKDTGFLAAHVRIVDVSGDGTTLNVQVGDHDFGGHVFFAAAVEYGTAHMPANPFMRRAVALDGPRAVAGGRDAFAASMNRG